MSEKEGRRIFEREWKKERNSRRNKVNESKRKIQTDIHAYYSRMSSFASKNNYFLKLNIFLPKNTG